MTRELKAVKLKDISKLIGSGITPSRSNEKYWINGTIPWLKTEQLGEYEIYETSEKITEDAIKETSIKVFPINTLSIAMYGEGRTRGNVSILKKEMTTNQACCNVVLNEEKANYKYVYYYLKTQYNQLRALSSGVRKNLNSNDIKEFEIRLPITLETQQKIADVLSALDTKIELNNRINVELEAMAKTLYDYWFVQFDFPNAEGKPYKTSGGAMVWNEDLKREIPEGWSVGELSDNIDNILDHRGKTPLKLGGDWIYEGEGITAISAKHVKGGKLLNLDDANRVSFEMYEKWMPEKLKDGDILMTSEAPLGEFYFILNDTNYCLSQRLFAIRANPSKVIPSYLYYELSKGNGYSQIIGSKSGSTVFGIRQNELRKTKVLKPYLDLQKSFDNKVRPMLAQIRNNEFQNKELSTLRDWLLPMLMNGQVVVE